MITGNREFAAAQGLHSANEQRIRGDPFDASTEGVEKTAEVLDVWFCRRVVDQRVSLGQRRGHDGVLRRGHRRLIEEHFFAFERARAHAVLVRGDLDLRAERFQREQMGVHAAAADDVAAGLRDVCRSAAREQRSGQENRGADSLRELCVRSRRHLALRVETNDIFFATFDANAELLDDLEHHADVLNVGKVVQRNRLIGQQTGSEDRQRGILVAASADGALEASSPFDDEALHGHGPAILSAILVT